MPCPNKGPGRYEGNAHPCLALIMDDESIADEVAGDTETGLHRMRHNLTTDHLGMVWDAQGPSPPCATCTNALKAAIMVGQVGIVDTDGNGFVTLSLVTPDEAVRMMTEAEGWP